MVDAIFAVFLGLVVMISSYLIMSLVSILVMILVIILWKLTFYLIPFCLLMPMNPSIQSWKDVKKELEKEFSWKEW